MVNQVAILIREILCVHNGNFLVSSVTLWFDALTINEVFPVVKTHKPMYSLVLDTLAYAIYHGLHKILKLGIEPRTIIRRLLTYSPEPVIPLIRVGVEPTQD